MPNLKENPRDRVLLAYEKELLDQIYGRNAAFPESSRQRAEELADEFCQTFLGNGLSVYSSAYRYQSFING